MINRERAQYTLMAKRLREIREHRGLTQKQLAQRMGVSVSAVNRWESCGTKDTAIRLHRWTLMRRVLKVAHTAAFEPLGTPIRSGRGLRIKRRRKSTVFQPLTFEEAQALLQCGPNTLKRLIRRGHLDVVLMRCIDARSLFACIEKRAGYNGG